MDISLGIQDLLKRAGFYNGKVDGKIGPETRNALAVWLDSLGSAPGSSLVTDHSSLSWPLESAAASFYGRSDNSAHWENENLVQIIPPYPMNMDGVVISRIRCHRRVAASLMRILEAIKAHYVSQVNIRAAGLDRFDGCYNFRPVRGASHLSMHAYGAAVDFDAEHNALGAETGTMPRQVVNIFKAEGWRWGGDYTGRKDWMHFEACR